jgi:hypothetical protein
MQHEIWLCTGLVSSDYQKADLQINALKKTECDYIFTDTISDTVKKRPDTFVA